MSFLIDGDEDKFSLMRQLSLQRNAPSVLAQLAKSEGQPEREKEKFLTITDLKTQLNKKSFSQDERIEILRTKVEKLQQAHQGYFNGKKLPFSKNQSFKQCIFSPYKADGSLISVQILGRLPAEQEEITDNLTRKMAIYENNAIFL